MIEEKKVMENLPHSADLVPTVEVTWVVKITIEGREYSQWDTVLFRKRMQELPGLGIDPRQVFWPW
jgi:hypothetical protein